MTTKLLAMLGSIALAASTWAAQAQSIELKLTTFHGPKHPVSDILRKHAEAVAAGTEGRVSVRVFDSGMLAGGPDTLNAVQRGVADIGNYVWTYAPLRQLPLLSIGSLPFVYRDGESYADAWEKDPYLLEAVNKHVSDRGYDNTFFAAPYFSGFARIGFRGRTPKTPDEIQNLKIRGTGSYNQVVEAYGAVDVTIESPEVFNALESGLIDGAVGLAANWINWRWMEPADYLLDFPIAPVGGAIAVNKASWEKVAEKDRAALENMFQGIQSDMSQYYIALEADHLREVSAQMTVYKPNAEEEALWFKPKDQIVQAWLQATGEEEGRAALAVVERFNK